MKKGEHVELWGNPKAVIGIALVAWALLNLIPYGLAILPCKPKAILAGPIGDAAGLANSFINMVAIIYLAYTFNDQRSQNLEQRKQMLAELELGRDERLLASLSSLVSVLSARLGALTSQRDDFEKTTPGSTPTRMSKEIDGLRSQIGAYLVILETLAMKFSTHHRETCEVIMVIQKLARKFQEDEDTDEV